MTFQGIPFIVTLDEEPGRTPQIKITIRIGRPYRATDENRSLMLDLYMLLVAHAERFGEVFGWSSQSDAKGLIASAVYEAKPKGLYWNGSWYSVEIRSQVTGISE